MRDHLGLSNALFIERARKLKGGKSNSPMSIQVLTTTEFISKIIQDSDTGRCFVPLIGSGLSSPSGIIMGMEFTNYLAFTTYLVLSDPTSREKTFGEGIPQYWDLRHQGWPPLPSNHEVELARNWLLKEFKSVCDRYDLDINFEERTGRIRSLTPRHTRPPSHEVLASLVHPQVPSILAAADLIVPEDRIRRVTDVLLRKASAESQSSMTPIDLILTDSSRSYRQRIVEAGIRSLHDWRETLVFLSSVSFDKGNLVYGPPVYSVIDRFNSTITRDKQPNLGHKMLAHLSGPLRIQSVMTTNFDTLIEDAFRALSYRVRVLAVSSKGHLPEPQTVGADFAVVKLHGEVQDTRADRTLDDEPSEDDKETFSAYLTRGAGNLRRVPPTFAESKRLLVIGYSGSDYRCVQMIKHWLEHGRENPNRRYLVSPGQLAYWVCFSNSDVERVKRLFGAGEYSDRIRVTQSSRPDLLLYELYQKLVLSLPPGGLTYEFAQVVPPRRLKEFDYPVEKVENVLACAKIMEHPLEASRVLLSDATSLNDAMQLSRDAAVLELKHLVLKSVDESVAFYDQNGNYHRKALCMTTAALWSPNYRDERLIPKDKALDDQQMYLNFNSRPTMIDSVGGCVRGVSMAVDHITATSTKKVFWFETQDYMDADGLLRDLLRSMAVRFGTFQGRQVTPHPLSQSLATIEMDQWEQTAIAISEHIIHVLIDYRIDANQVVVLLYGRDSYGSCSGLVPSPWGSRLEEMRQNGARSKRDSQEEVMKREFRPLHCIIEALGRAGVRTLYFPLTKVRADRKNQFPQNSPSRTWDIVRATRSESESWKKWDETRDGSDKWRSWPSDPFATMALSRATAQSDIQQNTTIRNSHEAGRGTSVFQSIVEKVLAPYFQFESKPDKGNSDTSHRTASQIPNLLFDKATVRKLIFLYGLTLFRHSRHANALCSEAVFHCPYRFNGNAIDNDFVRFEEIMRWIEELRSARVFFDKPGGSVWMHRDVRLTLQHFLEHLEFSDPSGRSRNRRGLSNRANSVRSNRNLREMRSRLHFWIGDWYQKAFCSSGHLTPIVESVHHRIMAAIYAPFARYKTINIAGEPEDQDAEGKYRRLLFESSLLEGQKTLHIAWKALKIWQTSPLEVAWVGDRHRKTIQQSLNSALNEICKSNRGEDWKGRLTLAVSGLIECLEALNQELLLEGGGGERDEQGLESKNTSPRPSPTNTGLSAYNSLNARHEKNSKTAQLRLDHGWRAINAPDKDLDANVDRAFANKRVGKAQSLLECIREIGNTIAISRTSSSGIVTKLSREKANWKAKFAHNPAGLHDTIWLLGEFAYIMLRRAKLSYHSGNQIDFSRWIQATVACNLGIDYCKHLPPWLLRYDIQSKVKLHTLYGVSLANIGRFFEATRHFNEAQALLSKMPDASPGDLAVIMLRRAEALLTECMWISMFIPRRESANEVKSSRPSYLKSTITEKFLGTETELLLIDGQPAAEFWSSSLADVAFRENEGERVIAVPPRIAECLRKASPKVDSTDMMENWIEQAKPVLLQLYKSVLDEAVTLLDLAETNLGGNSQSSLWWSRMHTLRLRIYGLLGLLEDSASDCLILRKRSADQGIYESFRNAMRIARDDPFRKLRSIKYFLEADEWHRTFDLGDNTVVGTRLPESFLHARKALEQLVKLASTQDIGNESLLGIAIRKLNVRFEKVLHVT